MVNARRARQLNRARARREDALREARRARRRQLAIITSAVVVVLAIIGAGVGVGLSAGSGHSKAAGKPTPTPTASAGTPVCDYIADTSENSQQGARHYGLPPDRKASGHPVATIVTNRGTITATLNAAKAPCTVNSFEFLAAKGYFNDTACVRLTAVPGASADDKGKQILQCGDPTGTGDGGPGYTIPDENLTGATYPVGTLAMANTGAKHSGGSQFFFVYGATSLPASYTPFATVRTGLTVLKAIAAKGQDNSNGKGDGKPNESVIIKSFTIKSS